MNILTILLIYESLISLISILVCIYDKWAAKHRPQNRTREATLLWLSALGGSIAMLITMLLIRHKTQHKKFMVEIPLIILLQIVAIACFYTLSH